MEALAPTKSAPQTLVNTPAAVASIDLNPKGNDDHVDMSQLNPGLKYGLLAIFTLAQFQEAGSISTATSKIDATYRNT